MVSTWFVLKTLKTHHMCESFSKVTNESILGLSEESYLVSLFSFFKPFFIFQLQLADNIILLSGVYPSD